jgi:hypothetical protein
LREGDVRIRRHLVSCGECRTAVRLLRSIESVNLVESEYGQAEAMVQRLTSVPALATGPTRRPVTATFVSDSWQTPMAASVRGAGRGVERRLRYRVKDILIDLVVDRLGGKSECFLRVSRRGRPLPQFVLSLGKNKILPSDVGFFAWTGVRPPRELLVWSPEISVRLGSIQW